MKALFIGGVKSGKSWHAEQYTLALKSSKKPIYLATSEPFDEGLKARVAAHKKQREDNFITLESPTDLMSAIENHHQPILIECITLWLNNMLHYHYTIDDILKQLDALLAAPNDIVFVQNDVGTGIMPDNKLARDFVDLSGIISQKIAGKCNEVFHCIAGISTKIKG